MNKHIYKHIYSLLIRADSFFEVLLFPPTGMFELGAGPQCVSLNNIPGMTNLTCAERHHHHHRPQHHHHHHHHQRGRHSPGFTLRRQSDPKHTRQFRFPTAGVKVDGKAAEHPSVPSSRAPNYDDELLWRTCDWRNTLLAGLPVFPLCLFCCQVKLALRGHAPLPVYSTTFSQLPQQPPRTPLGRTTAVAEHQNCLNAE